MSLLKSAWQRWCGSPQYLELRCWTTSSLDTTPTSLSSSTKHLVITFSAISEINSTIQCIVFFEKCLHSALKELFLHCLMSSSTCTPRAGCTSIASILTRDTSMLVGLGSECWTVLLMEDLKSWLLIGRANLVSTNGQVGSLFNARAVKIKQRVVLDDDRKQMNPPPYFGNPPQIPETV